MEKSHNEDVTTTIFEAKERPAKMRALQIASGLGLSASLLLSGCTNSVEAKIDDPVSVETSTFETYEGAQSGEGSTPEINSDGSYIESLPQGEELTEMFRIPVGLSDEELAETFISRLDQWDNFAATTELRDELWADTYTDMDVTIEQLASRTAEGIVAGLFAEEFPIIDNRQTVINNLTAQNEATMQLHVITVEGTTEDDKEGYRTWSEVTEILPYKLNALGFDEFYDQGKDRGMVIYYRAFDNSELNRADELTAGGEWAPPEGTPVKMDVIFKDGGDGFYYVNHLDFRPDTRE